MTPISCKFSLFINTLCREMACKKAFHTDALWNFFNANFFNSQSEKDAKDEQPIRIVNTTIIREKHIIKKVPVEVPASNPAMQQTPQSQGPYQNRYPNHHSKRKHMKRSKTFTNQSVTSTPRSERRHHHHSGVDHLRVHTASGGGKPSTAPERGCSRQHPHREKQYFWESAPFYTMSYHK